MLRSYLGVPKVGSLIGSKTISLLLASTILFSPAIQGLMLSRAGLIVQCHPTHAFDMWGPHQALMCIFSLTER